MPVQLLRPVLGAVLTRQRRRPPAGAEGIDRDIVLILLAQKDMMRILRRGLVSLAAGGAVGCGLSVAITVVLLVTLGSGEEPGDSLLWMGISGLLFGAVIGGAIFLIALVVRWLRARDRANERRQGA